MISIDAAGTAGRWTITDSDAGPLLTNATTDRATRFLADLLLTRAIDAQADATRADIDALAHDWDARCRVPVRVDG